MKKNLVVARWLSMSALILVLAGCASKPSSTAESTNTDSNTAPTSEPTQPDTPTPTPTQTPTATLFIVTGLSSLSSNVDVQTVDPTSGTATTVDSFAGARAASGDTYSIDTDAVTDYGATPVAVASVFSPDFGRVAAADTDSTAHQDLGWLTPTGEFTNVTTPLWKTGDFAAVPTYRNAQFGADGNFYFTDNTSSMQYSPGNFMETSATSPAKPTAVPGAPTDGEWYWMNPDHVVTSMNGGDYWYQENVTPGIGSFRVESWVNAKQWLGVDSDGSQVWLSSTLASKDKYDPMDWGTSGKALTPASTGFTVASPVVSPDGQTVAFLATQGGAVSIYTVPITGGQPTLVKTTATLDSTSVIAAWK